MYICDLCASINVEQKVWYNPNTGELTDPPYSDEGWCNDCQNDTTVIEVDEEEYNLIKSKCERVL